LRLSVTPRCNFRCTYCDPLGVDSNKPPGTLSAEYFEIILEADAGLGMRSVRFTDGETLLRKDLPRLIRAARAMRGVEDVAVTTNASALEKRLPALLDAGLDRVNISLDAVDPEVFKVSTGGGYIESIMRCGAAAVAVDTQHPHPYPASPSDCRPL